MKFHSKNCCRRGIAFCCVKSAHVKRSNIKRFPAKSIWVVKIMKLYRAVETCIAVCFMAGRYF